MDENKLKVLKDIGYQVQPCCGLCQHSTFPQNDWGTCKVQGYEHKKHTGPERELSIHRFGSCSKFKADLPKCALLGHFGGFLVEK